MSVVNRLQLWYEMKEEKKKLPKVLVAAPTYSGKHYIFPYWYKNVMELTYPNYDLLVVDNSKNTNYVNRLRRMGYKHILHVDRGNTSRIAIARASERIRGYAIENGYDYIMFIETDLIPQKDIIEKLLSHDKQIIGALYEVGLPNSKETPRRPLLYHKHEVDGETNISMLPVDEAYNMIKTGVRKTIACGFGCTLLRRDLFERISFKYTDSSKLHTDMIFYWELDAKGIPVYCDTDIIVPHYNQNWLYVKDY